MNNLNNLLQGACYLTIGCVCHGCVFLSCVQGVWGDHLYYPQAPSYAYAYALSGI
jgi:hypothetical protein